MKRWLPVLALSLLIVITWSGRLNALQQAVEVKEPVSRPIRPPASAVSTATQQPTPTPPPAPTNTPTQERLSTLYAAAPNFAGVNLRVGPGTEFSMIRTVPYGAGLQAFDSAYWGFGGERWYKVRSDDVEGYALGSLLSERPPRERPPIPTPVPTNSPAAAAQSKTGGVWTLTAVGDIMLSRNVLSRMHSYGSYSHPYEQTYDLLRAANLTVANLEGQLSDNIPLSADEYTMTFISPTEAAGGLRWAGIDAVSLANNHTLDYGSGALLDTMRGLDQHAVAYFGAGENMRSAYAPPILVAGGQRIAFLGFDDVLKGTWSDPSTPGSASASERAVQDAVAAAQTQADVVIPYFHWGSEYVAIPDGRQRSLAYAAIDAGADLVLGAHPHWVQTVEWYGGKPIVYSLGNFIFDQMWSRTTRQGVIATFTFAGSDVIKTRYDPILIEDYNQPRLATGTDYRAVLNRMGVDEVEP